MPFAANPVRQRNASRPAAAHPRKTWIAALIGAALALGGCLQDAQNQGNSLSYNNPNDPGALLSSSIAIVSVDYLSPVQTVTIVNSSGIAQLMTGWLLINVNTPPPPNQYTFGAFTIGVGTFVRVHSGTGTDSGTDLYAGAPGPTSPFPYSFNQTAELANGGGGVLSACLVGSPTC